MIKEQTLDDQVLKDQMVAEYLANCSELSPINESIENSFEGQRRDLLNSFGQFPLFSETTSR